MPYVIVASSDDPVPAPDAQALRASSAAADAARAATVRPVVEGSMILSL
jgi:hypothetical protein